MQHVVGAVGGVLEQPQPGSVLLPCVTGFDQVQEHRLWKIEFNHPRQRMTGNADGQSTDYPC